MLKCTVVYSIFSTNIVLNTTSSSAFQYVVQSVLSQYLQHTLREPKATSVCQFSFSLFPTFEAHQSIPISGLLPSLEVFCTGAMESLHCITLDL